MRVPIALIQTDAGADPTANVARAAALADEAAAGGAQLVALPEYLQFRGDDAGFRASARPIPGEFTDAGTVVAQAPDRECIVRAEIDSDRVSDVRRQIPVLANRRPAAYRLTPESSA